MFLRHFKISVINIIVNKGINQKRDLLLQYYLRSHSHIELLQVFDPSQYVTYDLLFFPAIFTGVCCINFFFLNFLLVRNYFKPPSVFCSTFFYFGSIWCSSQAPLNTTLVVLKHLLYFLLTVLFEGSFGNQSVLIYVCDLFKLNLMLLLWTTLVFPINILGFLHTTLLSQQYDVKLSLLTPQVHNSGSVTFRSSVTFVLQFLFILVLTCSYFYVYVGFFFPLYLYF